MAILVDKASRIIVQGMTGRVGAAIAARMVESGSPVVGGVAPGRGGRKVAGLPVVDSCYAAVAELDATASFVSVPAAHALDACLEAIDAGIEVIVAYTEGVPVADAIQMASYARARGVVLIGPNSAGCVSPGMANLSDLNDAYMRPGRIGIVSKSGTMTYEVIDALDAVGLGQSTIVCLGGDPVTGSGHTEMLERFEADSATEAVVLLGEIGGRSELEAAAFVARMTKPVVAYIAGRHAPAGKRMGHAGALLGSPEENAPGKIEALRRAGAVIVDDLTAVGKAVRRCCAVPT
ncbi:MAG TPA: succinate--CoA ligase subunit alpha [Alphaproteobacteria bacterium]|nr:succinate--CoA ligase subunit alpha [Alphaproteobacteria bacterium]